MFAGKMSAGCGEWEKGNNSLSNHGFMLIAYNNTDLYIEREREHVNIMQRQSYC